MAQKSTLPEGFEPDVPEGFEPDVNFTSHGASGSWSPMSRAEKVTRTVLGPVAGLGKGVVDAAENVVHSPVDIYNAATTVQNPGEEKLPFIGLAAKRLIYEPSIENAKAWLDEVNKGNAGSNMVKLKSAMGAIPVVGPTIKHLVERAESGDVSGAIGEGLTYAGAPKVVDEVAGKVLPNMPKSKRLQYAQDRPLLFTEPEGHLQNALKPDLDAAGLKLAGEQLKAGEAKIGAPVKDVDSAKAAAKAQFQQELMPTRRSIIDPQREVTVPGSRRKLLASKISAIPKDILPGTKEYANLVQRARNEVPRDLTIGELEDINTSLNSQNRGFHQAKLSQALGKSEMAQGAMDIATEQASRQLMEEGMEAHGLGGADKLKEINRRIGTLIKVEDAIDAVEKTARTEAAMPHFRRMTKRGATVNESIADAMRTWKTESTPVQAGPGWGPTRRDRLLPQSTSIDLGPSPDTSGEAYNPNLPPVYPPSGTPKLLTAHAGGPYTGPDPGPYPVTGPEDALPTDYAKGPFKTQYPETLQGKQGRMVLPSGPIEKTGRTSPGPLFKVSQTEAEAAAAATIPPGTKLMYKSQGFYGEMYHYQTPDGRTIVLDHELSPEMTKTPAAAPYDEGSSWAGNRSTNKPSLPEPPKRRTRKKS